MSVVMDIYGLIRDLMTEAEKVKDDKLYSIEELTFIG